MKVIGKNGAGCCVKVVGYTGPANTFFVTEELDAGKLVPRPIKVGDRVTWGTGVFTYEVLGIRDSEAWLGDERYAEDQQLPACRFTRVEPVSRLVRVPS